MILILRELKRFVKHFYLVIKEKVRQKKVKWALKVILVTGLYSWKLKRKKYGPNFMVIKER